jgi:hypothetical protein
VKSFIFYSWASDKTECRDQVAISEKRLFETPGTENASDELPREGTCSHLSVLSEFVSVGDGSHACILACLSDWRTTEMSYAVAVIINAVNRHLNTWTHQMDAQLYAIVL